MSFYLGRRGCLALVAVAVVGIGAGWFGRDFVGTAGADEDVLELARTQVDRFYQGTSGKLPLADVLGELFQLMRTDGHPRPTGPNTSPSRRRSRPTRLATSRQSGRATSSPSRFSQA